MDPVSLKILASAPVGTDPHEVVASSDGRTAYVSNTGFGSAHELSVIDLVAQKALPSVDTGPMIGPHGLAYDEGARAFVSCTPDNDVAVIDLKILEVTGHIDVGGRPDGLAWAVRRE